MTMISRLSFVIALALLFLAALLGPVAGSMGVALVVAWLFLGGSAGALVHAMVNPNRGAASLMAYFFFMFFVALPAVVQISLDLFPWGSRYTPEHLGMTHTILAMAMLSLMAGQAAVKTRGLPARPAAVPLQELEWNRYFMAVLVLLGLAFLAIVYVGPGVLVNTRGGLREMATADGGARQQIIFIGRSLALLSLVILSYLFLNTPRGQRRPIYAVSIVALPIGLLLFFPLSLPRFQMMGAALALIVMFVNLYRPALKIVIGTVGGVFLFYVFPVIKVLTRGGSFTEFLDALLGGRELYMYMLTADFDAYKQVTDTLIYYGYADHRWGYNFFGALLFFVPRALWPSKPYDTGKYVSEGLGYTYTNVSNPLPAEAMAAFGLIGVVFILFLFGVLIAYIERRALVATVTKSGPAALFVYALMAGYITIILRGALNGVAPQFGSAFLACFLVWLAVRTTTPQRMRA
ncbi:O-antigen polymerase [Phenylobacterium sp.]|uniref:O-antigen polymerase n=1 Tax=Phenylobacterium sp. TaxID=1871053 RepID=UPI002730CAC4|nr:O-antigen polymerase [Phenylobacterium sp.]MDP1616616.1 O-antigen polymerase [Phenylobacterium sp.]MDP1986329.1 O-antigen polymerase [Phenylobacterium sp.]